MVENLNSIGKIELRGPTSQKPYEHPYKTFTFITTKYIQLSPIKRISAVFNTFKNNINWYYTINLCVMENFNITLP